MRWQQGKNEESGKEPGTCQVETCQPWLGKRICFKGNGCYYRVLNGVWMQSDLCFKRIVWARLGRKGHCGARWKEGDELGAYFHSWDNWQSWRSLVSGKSMQAHLLTLFSHQSRQNFKWGFQFFKKIHEAIVIISLKIPLGGLKRGDHLYHHHNKPCWQCHVTITPSHAPAW